MQTNSSKHPLVSLIGLSLIAAPWASTSIAEDNDGPPGAVAAPLAPVVVVGTRHPRLATDVVGTVSVITEEEMTRRLVMDLHDLVREEPGVSADDGGSRFHSGGFRIRGIGGNRVMTLVDNVPIADRFNVGAYADSGRDYLDMGMVRRVEILRGPASTLYGSQALGGVVAIETLDPWDLVPPGKEENTGYRLTTGYRSDREAYHIGAQAAWADDRNGFLVALGWREAAEREPANLPDRDKLDRSDEQRQSALVKQVSRLGNGSTLTMTMDIDERERDTDMRAVLGTTDQTLNTIELLGEDSQSRIRAGVEHEIYPGDNTHVIWRAYTQKSETIQSTYETRPSNFLTRRFEYIQTVTGLGINAQHETRTAKSTHLIGFGAETQIGRIEQRRDGLDQDLENDTQTNTMLGETFPRRDIPLTDTLNAGIYLNDEIQAHGSTISIIPGLRYDFQRIKSERDIIFDSGSPDAQIVDMDSDRWTGNLGLNWQVTPGWSIYAQYAQGFRAPPPNDVNLTLDLVIFPFNVRSLPNPDLKPERSESFEIGTLMDRGDSRFSLAIFDNHYKDFIESRKLLSVDPITREMLFQSVNIDRARIYGAELRYLQRLQAWHPALTHWSVEFGGEWLRGENRNTGEPLNDVGPPRAVLAISWDPAHSPWALRTTSTFSGRQDRVDESAGEELFKPSGYSVHDLSAEYRINRNWMVRGRVYNLSDEHYHDWSTVTNRLADDPMLPYLAASGRHYGLSVQGRF